MSKQEKKRRLVEPWRRLHGAVWLIGLAILFWQGWFWPGILVLIALSGALEGILMLLAPKAFEEEPLPPAPAPAAAAPPAPAPSAPAPPPPAPAPVVSDHRLELLPSVCPKCGGPIRGHEVKWTGPQSADCPYCGANLPLQG